MTWRDELSRLLKDYAYAMDGERGDRTESDRLEGDIFQLVERIEAERAMLWAGNGELVAELLHVELELDQFRTHASS